MSKVYIISDTHFGHRNICKYRPMFPNAQTHDDTVAENILRICGKRDVLWLLGDCFFTWESVEYLKEMHKHIGYVNFVPGNHDTDNAERVEIFKECIAQNYFYKVGSMFSTNGFWLTHAPIHTNELYGRLNIHGHVHRKTVADERYINVSCENTHFVPVAMEDLKNPDRRKDVLVHYGVYDHTCNDFLNSEGNYCLVCGKMID